MSDWYNEFAAALEDQKRFEAAFVALVDLMRTPKTPAPNGVLKGHIVHDLTKSVWTRYPELFNQPGIYIWGAWTHAASRIQYVGIAGTKDGAVVGGRFSGRYSEELRTARRDGDGLRKVRAMFRGRRRTSAEIQMELAAYREEGVKVKESRSTRPARAERYAKVGLENLWYFVIPATGHQDGGRDRAEAVRRLRNVETRLTQCASAWQFRLFQDQRAWGFPLVNRDNVEPEFLSADAALHRAYDDWRCEGAWWQEMDSYFPVA